MQRGLAERPEPYLDMPDDDDVVYPQCEVCGNHIFDEWYYDVLGTIMCKDCLEDLYRCDTDKYVEDHFFPDNL